MRCMHLRKNSHGLPIQNKYIYMMYFTKDVHIYIFIYIYIYIFISIYIYLYIFIYIFIDIDICQYGSLSTFGLEAAWAFPGGNAWRRNGGYIYICICIHVHAYHVRVFSGIASHCLTIYSVWKINAWVMVDEWI